MAAPAAVLRILVTANGAQAIGQLRAVDGQLGKTASAGERMHKAVRTAMYGVGAAVGIAGVASAKLAVDFDKSMRNVNSIAQLPEKQFKSLEKSVLGLAGKTAQAPKTLAEGLYDIVSSGFKAKQGLVILHASAKAATAGLTDTATSTKAVVAVLNAYHLKAKEAGKVSDTLFQTVNRGVITFDELASEIGDVLPFASQMHINLNQVGAAISTMTKEGLSGAESVTRLKNLIVAFIKPSSDMAKAIKQTGASSAEALIQHKGLQGALEDVIKTTDGSKTSIAKLFPNIRALGGALSLTGNNAKSAQGDLKAFADTTGATDTVLKQQRKSVSYQWNKLKADLDVLAITMGDKLIPAMRSAVHWLSQFVEQMQQGKGAGGHVVDAVKGIAKGVKDFANFLSGHPEVENILGVIAGAAVAGKVIKITARMTGLDSVASGLGKALGRANQTVATMEVGTLIAKSSVGGSPVPVGGGGGVAGEAEKTAGRVGGAGWLSRFFFGSVGPAAGVLASVKTAGDVLRGVVDPAQRLKNIAGPTMSGGSKGIVQKILGSDTSSQQLADHLEKLTLDAQGNAKALNNNANNVAKLSFQHGHAQKVVDQFGHAVNVATPLVQANSKALREGAGQLDQFGPKAFSTAGHVHVLGGQLQHAGAEGDTARGKLHNLGVTLDNLRNRKISITVAVNALLQEFKAGKIPKLGTLSKPGQSKAMGGIVVPGVGTGDKVPLQAMVEPGEQVFVLNRNASAALDFLTSVNSAVPRFATGGKLSLAHPSGPIRSAVVGMGESAAAQYLRAHPPASGGISPNLAGGVSGSAQKIGRAMMLAAGWPASQWPALKALWTKESGWSPYAVNKSSGAYGIPQSLGHGHPYALGDVRGQIAWGLNYIRGRYGSPDAAWAHEVANNWYRRGGLVKGFASGGVVGPAQKTMERIWQVARNFYPGAARHGMPRTMFSNSVPIVGDLRNATDAGGITRRGQYLNWPVWMASWLVGKNGRNKQYAAMETLIHEWAHYFQSDKTFAGLKTAEGGAQAFTRTFAPQIYSALGMPFSIEPSRDDTYMGYVRNVRGRFGPKWIATGQFTKPGNLLRRGGLVAHLAKGGSKKAKAPPKKFRRWDPFKKSYEMLTGDQYGKLIAKWQKAHPKQRMPTGPTKRIVDKLGPKVPIVKGLSQIESLLSNLDIPVETGEIAPDQAFSTAQSIIGYALKHPGKLGLSPLDMSSLRLDQGTYSLSHFQGEVPGAGDLTSGDTGTSDLQASIDANTQAIKDLAAQQKTANDFAKSVSQTQYGALKSEIAMIVNGNIGGKVGLGFATPSAPGRVSSL